MKASTAAPNLARFFSNVVPKKVALDSSMCTAPPNSLALFPEKIPPVVDTCGMGGWGEGGWVVVWFGGMESVDKSMLRLPALPHTYTNIVSTTPTNVSIHM